MVQKLSQKQRLFDGVEVPEGLVPGSSIALKPCNLCGSSSIKQIYRQAHFPVVQCLKCNLLYADEHFKKHDLGQFYSGDYYQRAYVCHPAEIDSKIARDYVRAFRLLHARHGGGVLVDFGSARGTFIEALAASEMGPSWQVEGIDINAYEVALGRQRGLPVRIGDVLDAALEAGAYTAITAFSVLEHMQDPRAVLKELNRALEPGGSLLLIVPSGSCLIIQLGLLAARLFGERCRAFTDNVFHEEHLYYFSPETMRQMLQDCGFSVDVVGFLPSYLETHPPNPWVALGSGVLRLSSWLLRRQTMLVVRATKS